MKLALQRLWVYLFLPLGLLVLAACGSAPGQPPAHTATPTAPPSLPSAVQTAFPAPIASTGPAGVPVGSPPPTPTPVPPPPTHDPARPLTYEELRAAEPAAGGSASAIPPLHAWAVGRTVHGWQGWVVALDQQVGKTTIPATIVMEDPYAPPVPPPATAPRRPIDDASSLSYVLLENLAANQSTRLQVGQKVRFEGTITRVTRSDFRVWLGDAQVVTLADPPVSRPIPPDLQGLRIMLGRGACYGFCPIYRVTLFGNGLLVWEGDRYVQTGGVRMTTVDEATVRRVVAAFESTDYFAWNDRYMDQRITDVSSAVTAFERPGKSHSIEHYHGDPSAPRALDTLENEIDVILNTAQWVGKR